MPNTIRNQEYLNKLRELKRQKDLLPKQEYIDRLEMLKDEIRQDVLDYTEYLHAGESILNSVKNILEDNSKTLFTTAAINFIINFADNFNTLHHFTLI